MTSDELQAQLAGALAQINDETTTPKRLKITAEVGKYATPTDDGALVCYVVTYDPHAPMAPITPDDGIPRRGDPYPFAHALRLGYHLVCSATIPYQERPGEIYLNAVYHWEKNSD